MRDNEYWAIYNQYVTALRELQRLGDMLEAQPQYKGVFGYIDKDK